MEGERKGKEGLLCPFSENRICNDKCGLYCVGLKMCVLHSMNMHIKEVEQTINKRVDRTNQLLSFIEKKIEKNKDDGKEQY